MDKIIKKQKQALVVELVKYEIDRRGICIRGTTWWAQHLHMTRRQSAEFLQECERDGIISIESIYEGDIKRRKISLTGEEYGYKD